MIPFVVGAVLLQAIPAVAARTVPWRVGESFEYDGKYMIFTPGGATLSVVGIETVGGVPSWHFKLSMHVSVPLYKNVSDLESWTAVNPFVSSRFVHVINENGKQISNDDFHIFGDSGFYRNRQDSVTRPTPKDPLDDLAFVYYIRTMELKTGGKYTVPRYFRDGPQSRRSRSHRPRQSRDARWQPMLLLGPASGRRRTQWIVLQEERRQALAHR